LIDFVVVLLLLLLLFVTETVPITTCSLLLELVGRGHTHS
jgi:hypothetical protein